MKILLVEASKPIRRENERAEDYLQKNELMPNEGVNLLPKLLEDIICRIHRKRGIAFTDVPVH